MTNTALLTRTVTVQSYDRRITHRQRVLLGGKLVHSNGSYTLDCVFRNLSAFGARISIPKGAVVPDSFDLIDMKHGTGFRCRAVWREYPEIGVAFDAHIDLAEAQDPAFRNLKRLWQASQLSG